MKKPGAITPQLNPSARQFVLLSMLLFALWLTQLRFPPLSYPHIGVLLVVVAAGLGAILSVRLFKVSQNDGRNISLPASMVVGALFLIFLMGRWLLGGMPAAGATITGTWLWAATYTLCGFCLAIWAKRLWPAATRWRTAPVTWGLLILMSIVGLICGLHAVWQFHWAYGDAYAALLASIGDRAPDRTEMGLLHHLQVRRVASVWGDPNALATFSAMAIAASLEIGITVAGNWRWLVRFLASASILACLAAVYYSGSRAGVLDVAGLLVLFGLLTLFSRLDKGNLAHYAASNAVLLAMIAVCCISSPNPVNGSPQAITPGTANTRAAAIEAAAETQRGWIWRSDTIRERIYYWQTGLRMVELSPVWGLAPGGVELYFGRLKPPEAREARHLHNWWIQTAAETGLVGAALLTVFVALIIVDVIKKGIWRQPGQRAMVVIFAVMVFDGLVTISWNQRELMCTLGLVCGLLAAESAVKNPSSPRTNKLLSRVGITGALFVAVAFLGFESINLSARNYKQIASDAAYAGDARLAEEYWTKASQRTPRDPEPLVARATLSLERGQLSAARKLVEKALTAQPESAATHSIAAQIYIALRQLDKADTHLTEAIRIYPSHPEYNYAYASFLVTRNEPARAVKYAETAARNNYKTEDTERYQQLLVHIRSLLNGNTPD